MNRILLFLLFVSVAAFGQQTDASLTTQSNVIRDETAAGGNTKTRIAAMYKSIIDSKVSILAPRLLTTSTLGYVWTATDGSGNGSWQPSTGSGDMLLGTVQINTALKTFLDGTFGMRNVANTFTSQFTNTNSAARTYTLPNINGSVLLDNFDTDVYVLTSNGSDYSIGDGIGNPDNVDIHGGTNISLDAPTLTFSGTSTFTTPIAATSVATMTSTVGGGVPTPPNNTTTFLRGDGTFAAPSSGFTVASLAEAQAGTDNTKGMTPLRVSDVTAKVFNVKSYGAKGDGQRNNVGGITSGTSLLNSTTANFVVGDIGKTVEIPGAGAAGVVLVTTITGYNSATQVVVAATRFDYGYKQSNLVGNG